MNKNITKVDKGLLISWHSNIELIYRVNISTQKSIYFSLM